MRTWEVAQAHSRQIVLYAQTVEISSAKHDGPKVLIDGLEKRLCGCMMQVSCYSLGVPSVAIDSSLSRSKFYSRRI